MYDLEKVWDSGLRLSLQRRSAFMHRLVIFAGLVLLVAGAGLYFLGYAPFAVATPFGSGIALLFGACFLLEFHRARPADFTFDHDARELLVTGQDGSAARLPYELFRDFRVRRQGRRWIVYLAAVDGSYWDLSTYGGRHQALELRKSLADRVILGAKAKRRNVAPAAESNAIDTVESADAVAYRRTVASDGAGTYFYWPDRLTTRGSIYMLGLLCGFALALVGFAGPQIRDPLHWQIAGGVFAALLLYVIVFILRGIGQVQIVAVDAGSIRFGAGRLPTKTDVPRPRSLKKVARADCAGLWHSFDMQSGLESFLLLNEDARKTFAALYTEDRADYRDAWRAIGVRLKTPRISLSGLSLADTVRLRAELGGVLFPG